jgi:hypothetical protein
MSRRYRVALLVLISLTALVGGYAGWTRLRSPESAAEENSYAVWIAVLKGFSGDVVYVGSDETHAYFRIGRIFWSHYKVPACAASLPEMFSVGAGRPYAVQLQVEGSSYRHFPNECGAQFSGYNVGYLERVR